MSNYNHSGNVDSVMYHHNNNSLNGHHGGYESSDQQYMHQSFSQPVFNNGNNNNIDTYSYVQYISHKQPQFNLYDYDYEYKAPTSNTTNNVQLNSSSYFSQPVSHSQQQQQQQQPQQHHHNNHPRRNQSFNYHSSSGRHHGGIMEKKPSSPVFLHNGSTHMNGVNSASSAFLVPNNNVSESGSSNQRSSPIKSYNELMEGLQRQYQHHQQQYLYAKYFPNSTNKHSGTSTLTRNHHNRKSPPQQLAQIKESFGHGISNGIKSTTSPTKAIVGSTGQYFQSGGINIRFAVNGLSKFSKSGLSLPLNKNIQAGDFGDDAGMIAENSRCIVIGLADGAGGNRNIGIDPQRFSRSLLGYCVEIIKNESIAPTQMAKLACRSIHILEAQQIDGSGTLCLLALDKQTNVLHALNIGDSGFRVVRQGNIVEKSNATMAGSSPKQLYVSDSSNYKGISFINEGDIAQDSDQRKFHVRPGDLIILSSDGLYDVVEDEKIERIVRSREENDLQGMADDLLSQAMKSYIHTQRDDILVMVCKIESKDH